MLGHNEIRASVLFSLAASSEPVVANVTVVDRRAADTTGSIASDQDHPIFQYLPIVDKYLLGVYVIAAAIRHPLKMKRRSRVSIAIPFGQVAHHSSSTLFVETLSSFMG
jgi:hypothetical protein